MDKKYLDIISIHRPFSNRPKMSNHDRAAQFSPFAALTGYDDAIDETARFVDKRIELDEESLNILDQNLQELRERIISKPIVEIVYFVKDEKKIGGSYQRLTKQIKKIDEANHQLIFIDNSHIDIDDICFIDFAS